MSNKGSTHKRSANFETRSPILEVLQSTSLNLLMQKQSPDKEPRR